MLLTLLKRIAEVDLFLVRRRNASLTSNQLPANRRNFPPPLLPCVVTALDACLWCYPSCHFNAHLNHFYASTPCRRLKYQSEQLAKAYEEAASFLRNTSTVCLSPHAFICRDACGAACPQRPIYWLEALEEVAGWL